MISAQEIEQATKASEGFKPAVLAVRYHADTDRVEIVTPWCTLVVDRHRIEELRGLSPHDLESISMSPVGIHVEGADIDINAAGLITGISRQLETEVANSF
jgi:hypothetical protein